MSLYTLHYTCDTSDTHKISCSRLAQTYADRLRELYPPPLAYRPAGWNDHSDESDWDDSPERPTLGGGAPPGAGSDPAELLADPGLWASVAELQWALVSDRAIRGADLACTLARLRADGEYGAVRQSCLALAGALAAVHPGLQAETLSARLQLVALGADMALGAAGEPEILRYVKNELQPVDLAAALSGP